MEKIFSPIAFDVFKNGYSKPQFISDLFAGLIVGIVALPLAIAFAVASGVSPEKGIITAVIAGFIISFLGGSRVQIGGPTGAFIVIVYGILEQYGLDGLMISTIMAGIILVIFGLLKLGTLLKFIPYPLIVGFTSGIAMVILSTQIKDALGLEIVKLPSEFLEKFQTYAVNIHTFNYLAVIITLVTILVTVYFKKITTKIPGSIVAIILITAVVQILKLPVTTIETFFPKISGDISFSIPHFDFHSLGGYIAPALIIALLGGIESLLSAVVADGMIGTNHRSNTELIAQGIANIVTPFLGGIPATGAIARTATNVKNGGRTPLAGMIHAVVLLLIMLFLGQWAKLIPMSCLAGILIVVAYNMSEWKSFISIFKGSIFDVIVLLTTFFLTVLVDLTVAIQVGIVLSSLLFMKRMADSSEKITHHSTDTDVLENYSGINKNIGIYEISGPLFFASAKRYAQVLEEIGSSKKILIIRMRHVPFVDSTGIKNLKSVIENIKQSGTKVVLSGVKDNVREDLDKHRISFLVGKSNIHSNFKDALAWAEKCLEEM